jgi:hypothetical protein
MALELFGVGIASRHHRRSLGDAPVRLPQPHAVLANQPVEPFHGCMQQLGIGREGDGLGLDRGVHRDALEIARAQCARVVGHSLALSQQKLQPVTEALAPMAQVRALMRECVMKKRLAGEVLEIGIMDPALAHALVGEAVNVLEQEQTNHEPSLDPRSPLVAVERRDLLFDPLPVDLAGELNQLVLHVDDLIEPGPEQIAFRCRLQLLRSHRPLRCSQ